MGNVTTSGQNNITSPNGNSLAVFVDGVTQEMKVKDVMGNIQPLSDFVPTLPYGNYGLYAQTSDSTPITATTTESSLVGTGVGTLSVPANAFTVGSCFNANFSGTISAVNSATIRIRVKTLAGVVLSDSGAIALNVATNRHWTLDLSFTIRKIGGAGVSEIFSSLLFSYIRNSAQNYDGYAENFINNTTFDTTVSNTLVVTAQWNSNNANNSIYSSSFVLSKVY